jgi:hypothetical protein
MINTFISITIILLIWLISIDMALFAIRRKRHADGKSLGFNAQKILPLAKAWLGGKTSGLRKSISLLSANRGPSATQDTTLAPLEEPTPTAQSFPANVASAKNSDSVQSVATPALLLEPTSAALASPEEETFGTIHSQLSESTTSPAGNKTVHIQISADIPEGSVVHITLEVADKQGKFAIQKQSLAREGIQESAVLPASENNRALPALQKRIPFITGQFVSNIRQRLVSQATSWNQKIKNLDRVLLLTAIAIYALVVSLGIDRYPIYFFTDEAIHMNLASDFLRDGYENYYGEFMPTFFTTQGWVNGTSVYVQVLPLMLFGKSVVVTRLVSAFISLLGALAAALLLRDAFKLKYYWAGMFLVLTTPAWFLHSRTAFEYVEVGSFYSIFLYFYSRYRAGYLRSLYWAIIAGALCFYTHGLGQILMGVTGLALFAVDFRYHLHPDRRKTVLRAILLGTILLLPFVRYYIAHPGEAAAQVKRRGSYWVDDNLTFVQKIGEFFRQYLYGLNPMYWYLPNNTDLSRHIMYKYGNGLWYTLPLVIAGLIKTFRNLRQPTYRIVLIALFVCPIPASVVAIGMPRMLWMTLPLALLGAIGLVAILEWAEARWHFRPTWIATGLFILLAGLSLFMLRDALVKGPIWFNDYTLYGMQYGAKQVFQDVVQTGLEKNPNRRYVVSPSWANGTEQFVAFFVSPEYQPHISMGQPIDFIDTLKTNPPEMYFVATPDEYDKLLKNPEFKDINVNQILPYPDGKPGFYVIMLKVSDNIDQIIANEHKIERQPVEDTMLLNEQTVRVIHSPLGSGRLEDIFDNNPDTLARVLEANPFTFDLYLTTPINTNSIVVQTGSLTDFTVTVKLYASGATDPVTYTQTYKGLPPDPLVTFPFDKGPAVSARIYIEIRDNSSGDSSQIHVRTIQFK